MKSAAAFNFHDNHLVGAQVLLTSSTAEYWLKDAKSYKLPCEFSYHGSEGRLNDTFTEKDIAKFSELLKQLPEVNAERLAKESKAEQEQSLFKR